MNRRALFQMAIGSLGLSAAGCLTGLRFWDRQPRQPEIPPAHVETSRRVHDLTKRIIDQNTFTGIDPIVSVPGIPQAVLFHCGTEQLIISEGLVKKCLTEAELAAVLCSELGKMMSQQRAAAAVGRSPDPIPDIALPKGTPEAENAILAEEALWERRRNEKRAHEQSEPVQIARKLLAGAGFDPTELDRVEPMVKQSERGEQLRKQFQGNAPAPAMR